MGGNNRGFHDRQNLDFARIAFNIYFDSFAYASKPAQSTIKRLTPLEGARK